MIVRLLALLALPVLAFYLTRSLSRRFSLSQRQQRILMVIIAALLVVGVLVIMGRVPVHFILAPLGAIFAFVLRFLPTVLRLLPMWSMLKSRVAGPGLGARSQNQNSTIRTRFLAMSLSHSTGHMDGEVLEGSFQGRQLATLSLEELLQLLRECSGDADSAQVLEAYLDRQHADWRQHRQSETGSAAGAATDESSMTAALALEILGLEAGADRQAVVKAHRHLMQKLHPDRGGSDYLAKKINAAKDFLLRQLED